MTTKFIKIVNNNNANEFCIDITNMVDVKMRISTLKNAYKIYQKSPDKKLYRNIYKFFTLDYSFYVMEKGNYDTLKEARIRREEIIFQEQSKKRYIKNDIIGRPFANLIY